jgi:hypothetical protein
MFLSRCPWPSASSSASGTTTDSEGTPTAAASTAAGAAVSASDAAALAPMMQLSWSMSQEEDDNNNNDDAGNDNDNTNLYCNRNTNNEKEDTTHKDGSDCSDGGGCNMEQYLTEELLRRIFTFLSPQQLLQGISCTCVHWATLVKDDAFWRQQHPSCRSLGCRTTTTRQMKQKENNLVSPVLPPSFTPTLHQLQRYAVFQQAVYYQQQHEQAQQQQQRPETTTDQKTASLLLYQLQHGSVLTTRKEGWRTHMTMQRATCVASTTDRPGEAVTNVLPVPAVVQAFSQRFGRGHFAGTAAAVAAMTAAAGQGWWSSQPTVHPDDRNETILVTTKAPVTIVTQIQIKPLLDPYVGHVVYSWKSTTIRAYWVPHDPQKISHGYPCTFPAWSWQRSGRASDQALIHHLLQDQTPVFVQTWPVEHADRADVMTFNLPQTGVVANVITIELHGKHHEQVPGSGYYACVESLNCYGIPLYATVHDAQQCLASERPAVLSSGTTLWGTR